MADGPKGAFDRMVARMREAAGSEDPGDDRWGPSRQEGPGGDLSAVPMTPEEIDVEFARGRVSDEEFARLEGMAVASRDRASASASADASPVDPRAVPDAALFGKMAEVIETIRGLLLSYKGRLDAMERVVTALQVEKGVRSLTAEELASVGLEVYDTAMFNGLPSGVARQRLLEGMAGFKDGDLLQIGLRRRPIPSDPSPADEADAQLRCAE